MEEEWLCRGFPPWAGLSFSTCKSQLRGLEPDCVQRMGLPVISYGTLGKPLNLPEFHSPSWKMRACAWRGTWHAAHSDVSYYYLDTIHFGDFLLAEAVEKRRLRHTELDPQTKHWSWVYRVPLRRVEAGTKSSSDFLFYSRWVLRFMLGQWPF